MSLQRIALALALVASGVFLSAVSEPRDIEQLLREADALRSSDPAQFDSLLEELDARMSSASDRQREQLRYLQAYRLGYAGKFDQAIEQATALFEQTGHADLKLRVGAFIANSYALQRRFAEAFEHLDRTLPLVEQTGDAESRAHAMLAAAIIYNQAGQHELGRHHSEAVLADRPSDRHRCVAGHLRIESLYHLRLLPVDTAGLQAVIEQCDAIGEPLASHLVRTHLARQQAERGGHRAAIELLEQHLPAIEATRYPRLVGEVHALLAELWLQQGDLARADTFARKALTQPADGGYALPVVMAQRVLYEVARAHGDLAAALDRYMRYSEADKAYLNEAQARALAFQLARHETLRKNQTIELLNRQNDVLRLEHRIAQQSARNNWLLVGLLSVLLASTGFWAYKIKRLQLSFRRLAETDALTGARNRHAFGERARAGLAAARRTGSPSTLLMFDLDRFKSINDIHGHAAGDWVLQRAFAACRRACRPDDLIGRLGGEEFAVLLLDCEPQEAERLAESCRAAIAAVDPSQIGAPFAVSASFGMVDCSGGPADLQTLLARADQALYAAKRSGRNRVERWMPALAGNPGADAAQATDAVVA